MKVKIKFKYDYLTCHPDGSDWVIKAGEIHQATLRKHPVFKECYYFTETLFFEKTSLAWAVEEISNSLDFIIKD